MSDVPVQQLSPPDATTSEREPSRPRRTGWALGVGGLAVGLVLGGCSGLGVGALGGAALVAGGTSGLGGALEDRLAGGGDDRTVAEALPDELPRLRAFVASERGLEWVREVPVEALEGAAFEEALAGDGADEDGGAGGGDGDGGGVEEDWAVGLEDPDGGRAETYAALGLTPSATDYRDAWEVSDSVVRGFYDTEGREVVLRGAAWTPVVEETLVHELTHALDDQHVDLDAVVGPGASPEATSAATAVVEGDAERTAWAWYDALDEDGLDAYAEASDGAFPEDEDADGQAYDPLLDALALFPYDYGYVAVDAVADDAGADGISDLLRHPLTTTEQVLAARPDPGASAGLAPAVDVPALAAPDGAELLGTGSLGLFPLSLLPLVADAEDEDEGYYLDPDDGVVTYAWAGDAWTTWVDPADDARACTAVVVRLDDTRGRDDLAEDLATWVDDASGVGAALEPVGDTDLRLTGCGER